MTAPIADLLREGIARARWHSDPACDPTDVEAYMSVLRQLYAAGRDDLPLGRLLEGHVDAVQIVHRYGSAAQVEGLGRALLQGAMLGVWNAGLAGAPLLLDGDRLSGGKSYASGAGVLTHALVTAETGDGPQLLLLDLAQTPPAIDRGWWHTTGMQRSETHIVRWDAAPIRHDDRIGAPGDYPREPWFSGGALRFVAVHAGGVAALCDHARDHLTHTGRTADPFQAARLSELFGLAEVAAAAVERVARRWFEEPDATRLARVSSARLTVTDAAERAIVVAREAVGLSGLFVDHPLSATLSDLSVYLRQPALDAARLRVGSAVAAGHLCPTL